MLVATLLLLCLHGHALVRAAVTFDECRDACAKDKFCLQAEFGSNGCIPKTSHAGSVPLRIPICSTNFHVNTTSTLNFVAGSTFVQQSCGCHVVLEQMVPGRPMPAYLKFIVDDLRCHLANCSWKLLVYVDDCYKRTVCCSDMWEPHIAREEFSVISSEFVSGTSITLQYKHSNPNSSASNFNTSILFYSADHQLDTTVKATVRCGRDDTTRSTESCTSPSPTTSPPKLQATPSTIIPSLGGSSTTTTTATSSRDPSGAENNLAGGENEMESGSTVPSGSGSDSGSASGASSTSPGPDLTNDPTPVDDAVRTSTTSSSIQTPTTTVSSVTPPTSTATRTPTTTTTTRLPKTTYVPRVTANVSRTTTIAPKVTVATPQPATPTPLPPIVPQTPRFSTTAGIPHLSTPHAPTLRQTPKLSTTTTTPPLGTTPWTTSTTPARRPITTPYEPDITTPKFTTTTTSRKPITTTTTAPTSTTTTARTTTERTTTTTTSPIPTTTTTTMKPSTTTRNPSTPTKIPPTTEHLQTTTTTKVPASTTTPAKVPTATTTAAAPATTISSTANSAAPTVTTKRTVSSSTSPTPTTFPIKPTTDGTSGNSSFGDSTTGFSGENTGELNSPTNVGLIIGIVVAYVIVMVLVIAIVVYIMFKRRRKKLAKRRRKSGEEDMVYQDINELSNGIHSTFSSTLGRSSGVKVSNQYNKLPSTGSRLSVNSNPGARSEEVKTYTSTLIDVTAESDLSIHTDIPPAPLPMPRYNPINLLTRPIGPQPHAEVLDRSLSVPHDHVTVNGDVIPHRSVPAISRSSTVHHGNLETRNSLSPQSSLGLPTTVAGGSRPSSLIGSAGNAPQRGGDSTTLPLNRPKRPMVLGPRYSITGRQMYTLPPSVRTVTTVPPLARSPSRSQSLQDIVESSDYEPIMPFYATHRETEGYTQLQFKQGVTTAVSHKQLPPIPDRIRLQLNAIRGDSDTDSSDEEDLEKDSPFGDYVFVLGESDGSEGSVVRLGSKNAARPRANTF